MENPDLSKPDKEVCPICNGHGKLITPSVIDEIVTCPTCSGTGTKGGE